MCRSVLSSTIFRHVHGEYSPPDMHPRRHGRSCWTDISGTIHLNYSAIPGTNYSESLVFQRTDHPTPFPRTVDRRGVCAARRFGFAGLLDRSNSIWESRIAYEYKNRRVAQRNVPRRFLLADQDTNRQPTSVSYDGTTVKIMPMAGFGMFQGTLSNGGKEMSGDWIQNGQRIPTTFTRKN